MTTFTDWEKRAEKIVDGKFYCEKCFHLIKKHKLGWVDYSAEPDAKLTGITGEDQYRCKLCECTNFNTGGGYKSWLTDPQKQALLSLIAEAEREARQEELTRLTKHRDFIYWGDGASSDLDKYLADRQSQLKAKDGSSDE